MNFPRFQSLIVLALTFFSIALSSQTNGTPAFKTVFTLDSLAGFDEAAEKNKAFNKGLYGMEFNAYMYQQKRIFVNGKYNLPYFDYEANYVANYSRYGSASTNNAPCVNEDFETNSFTGWALSQGTTNAISTGTIVYGACVDNPCPTSISTGSLASIVSTPYADAVINYTIPNSPFGGSKIARLNTNTVVNGGSWQFKAVKMTQNFPVTSNNSVFEFAYFAVMDASSPHGCCEQPYMYVKIRDCNGFLLSTCPVFSITVPGSGCPLGTGVTNWTTTAGIARSNGWQQYSIDLTQWIGCNITAEVTVGHCQYGGHYAYAYFDSRCSKLDFNVNGNLVNAPTSSPVSASVACATTGSISAPGGFGPYLWNGPSGSGVTSNTNQTIFTTVPGTYSITLNPPGICNPINRYITLSFPPPTTITVSSPSLCASGTNTSSTLSASGSATNYTWSPGGSTLSTIVVSPTITTIYTLTAKNGTCIGTFTTEVTVNPNPGITVLASTFTVCPGQSATLTASGASLYAWNPGALSGSFVVVTPTVTTSYTTVGTASTGCTGSAVTTINASAAILLTLTPIPINTPTYNCAGTPVSIVAGGATTFTWLPDNLNGFFQTLSPTVTTQYTVIGASGSCSNSANITLSVNPGPSITITPNPATVCPGNSTTLTATAAGAVGNFTWAAPVSSNAASVVVTPTVAGGYSVSAKDAMGCVSTYTANPNLSPIPSISISPSSPSVCFGSSVTLNASGAVNYTWLPGNSNATSISVSPTVNTTYTLIGANAAGCTVQAVTIVTVVPLPLVNASINPSALCAGSCATVTPSGALTYTITGGSMIVCPLTNSNYSVTGTDAAGCTSTPVVVSATVNPTPTLVATASPTSICQGASSTLSVTGGTSYTWSTGSNATSVTVSPTVTTIYTVTGVNGFGCTSTRTVQVIVVPAPSISITPSSASLCAGGSVNATASGASTYTWSPGSIVGANVTLSPSITTTYSVVGQTSGCTGQNTLLVTVAPVPTISASLSPTVICAGSCATISPLGATSYTYSSGSAIVCPTINSTYTVTGSNASGCVGNTVVLSLSVNAAPNLSVSASPTAVCPGNSSNLSASGAVTYTWLPMNVTGANISVTPTITTTYTVVGANSTGCTNSQTVSVIFVPTPTVTASATPTAICIGNNAVLSAFGAASYVWMPGSLSGANVFVSPTVTTNYSVTGTTSGCTGSTVVTLIVNPLPTLSITANPTAICVGGTATLTGSGAVSYTWNTGSFTSSIFVSPPSTTTYSLIGASAAGCVGNMVQLTLPVNALPVITATATPTVICSGGGATLTAGGGISYTWQPINLTGVSVIVTPTTLTTYTVSGVNANGCVGTKTVQVNVSTPPFVFISSSSPSICAGASATLSAAGAVNYTWLPGGSTATNIIVNPGSTTTYTLLGANAAGCVGQANFILTVQPNPIVTSSATPASVCAGSSVTLNAGGASSYTWQPINLTGATQIITPSVTTTYTVFGSASGCSGFSSVTVIVNPLPAVFAIGTPTNICAGSSAVLSAGGATSYNWSPGSLTGANVTISPVSTIVYTVTGSVGACSGTANVTIVVSPNPTMNVTASSTNICVGQSLTLTASGSSSFYTWSPSGTGGTGSTQIYTPSVTTTYTVFGASGSCAGFTTITVFVNPLPTINAFASPANICFGAASTLSASGASSYTWQPVSMVGNPISVTPSITTVYTVTGLSAAGCANSITVSVSVTPLPSLNISSSSNPICSGTSATLTASGATTYSWVTGSNASSIIVSPPLTTAYTLAGTSGPGCSSIISYTLVVNPSPTINIIASTTSVCAGFSVSLLATGAPSFTWNPGGSTSNPLFDIPTGTTVYSVTGMSGSCSSTSTINITVVPLPNVSVASNPTAVCIGNTTTLTASGAVTYSWIPSLVGGSTFIDAPTVATTYTVVGFSAAGCPNFDTVSVNVLPNPTITAFASSGAVCIGSSATLSANGAISYTWNPGSQTGTSIIVNPSVPTVYTVTGSNGGCAGFDTISVGVNSLPIVSANASGSPLCAGQTVNLAANGAINYTWNPSGLTGATIVDNPLTSTTYTVSGEDLNGCIGFANVSVIVNPLPPVAVVATPTTICFGSVVVLNASGALTYNWSNNQSGPTITDSPSSSTIYSVNGTDANGCIGSASVLVNVVPIPTITIAPINPSICIGTPLVLMVSGAINYTWLPSGMSGSVDVVNPTVYSTYTVLGDNGGNCVTSATVGVFVNPLPANVSATSSGTVTCSSPTAALFGLSTDTNVSYSWSGPSGYTSSLQNAIASGVWGDFTLTVTDNATGCSSTATVNIPTDNTIPLVTPVVSGSITCAVSVVTITAMHTTTNPAYSWIGPGGFTSTSQSATISLHGNYTVTVTDLSSTCSSTAVVGVGTHTRVEVTASITPATCDGEGESNNDGKINILGFLPFDKYDIVGGSSYTGTATYATAVTIPTNSIITNNLANPSTTVAYTIRLFDGQGCIKDTTLYLIPVNCSIKTLGIAKSVSTPFLNDDGSYDITYKVVVKNYDTGTLNSVSLTENLAATFASPTNFTVLGPPIITPTTSSLTKNNTFNGTTQTNLLQGSVNTIASGKADTLTFTVRVRTAIYFTPFNNTVLGSALNNNNKTIQDSSNTGLNPDPDNDSNPYNNNIATAVSFTPNTFFGITKVGAITASDNETYDVSYTITIHNLGNDTVRNVSLNDSLFEKTIKNPGSYTMKSGPVLTGSGLSVNATFDGKDDIRLILPNESKLAPNTVSSISFTINVIPGSTIAISNSAYGSALRKKSATLFETVSDTSGNGLNPDINNNNVWNESEDNQPTVLLIPSTTQTLFIPQGFSPNGDNINDLFVIQGLPTEGENSIVFFNRWGNKVYENGNYDNSWDGTSNGKATLGKNKLPVGTYFYILDMKNSGIKPISGFINIEY